MGLVDVALGFAVISFITALVYAVVVWVLGVQKIVAAWRTVPRRNRITFVVTLLVCLALTAGLVLLVPWSSLLGLEAVNRLLAR